MGVCKLSLTVKGSKLIYVSFFFNITRLTHVFYIFYNNSFIVYMYLV